MVHLQPITVPVDEFLTEAVRLLASGCEVVIRPGGDSMFPFLVGGRDTVTLKRIGRYVKGDLVLALVPGMGYVLHRIYSVSGDVVLLMGDGNLHKKESCRMQDILAVATSINRNGKTVDCMSRGERTRVCLWKMLLPIRRILLKMMRL